MTKLIALCDGHGMQTAGKRTPLISELGRFIHENEFNRAVVKLLDVELKRCGFRTLLVAPNDSDTPLDTRINLANKANADAYISVHYNAFDGTFAGPDPEGISVHIFPGSTVSRKLAECVHAELIKGTKQKNRGIISSNFAVLRDTKMMAILSENGFMDNKREAMMMIEPSFQKEVAVEHAKGICKCFNVAYKAEAIALVKPVSNKKTFFRIVTGSFSDEKNAEARQKALEDKGFDSFIEKYEK